MFFLWNNVAQTFAAVCIQFSIVLKTRDRMSQRCIFIDDKRHFSTLIGCQRQALVRKSELVESPDDKLNYFQHFKIVRHACYANLHMEYFSEALQLYRLFKQPLAMWVGPLGYRERLFSVFKSLRYLDYCRRNGGTFMDF